MVIYTDMATPTDLIISAGVITADMAIRIKRKGIILKNRALRADSDSALRFQVPGY